MEAATRAAVLCSVIVLMAFGAAPSSPAAAQSATQPSPFTDVATGHRYAVDIGTLASAGVTDGFSDGTFRPDAPVARQQYAKLLSRSLRLPVDETHQCPFTDVRASGSAQLYPDNYIGALSSLGIVRGTSAGSFEPFRHVLRAQAVALVVRSVEILHPGTLKSPPNGYRSAWDAPLTSTSHSREAAIAEFNRLTSRLPLGSLDPWKPLSRGEAAALLAILMEMTEVLLPEAREDEIVGTVTVGADASEHLDGASDQGTAGAAGSETEAFPGETPIVGATVKVQATDISARSDERGRFVLRGLEPGRPVDVSAWAPGYYIGGGETAAPGTSGVQIRLEPHPREDNPGYEWLSAYGSDPDEGTCERCHSAQSGDPGPLPFDEWVADAHSSSARNERFLTMYTGTDLEGNQSPPTRYIYDRDYGLRPLPPDRTQPYYGPGYRLDFPDTNGNCATCHVPAAAVNRPYGVDPLQVTGVAAEGIGCDFCHKIYDVLLDAETGLPRDNATGVLSFEFRRPGEGHQFFSGPFDDVAPGEDVYSPLQTKSAYCAPCHSARFWGTMIYNSYGEWLDSPYSDPETGQTCQDCHMPVTGAAYFARPDEGGRKRDPAAIRSHLMPGAMDEALLGEALTLSLDARREEGLVAVDVTVTNDRTGHHVPTDSPLRQVILLITATDSTGRPLELATGPTVPPWGGSGDPAEGYYGGLPGTAYAKVLREKWTGISPTGAYWNPTEVVSDTRLAPFESDTTRYRFTTTGGSSVEVEAALLFRRAFVELADQKGWKVPDIVMERAAARVGAP